MSAVVAVNLGRTIRAGDLSPDAAIAPLDAEASPNEEFLTQPLQIVVGGVPGEFGSYRDGLELVIRARSQQKDVLVVPEWLGP